MPRRSSGSTPWGCWASTAGALRDTVTQRLWLPTPGGEYELVEDAHAALCHAITVALKSDLPVDQQSA